MRNTLDSLESYYNVALTDTLLFYKDGDSLNTIVEKTGITNMRLRNIFAVLNLRLKQKYRLHDITTLENKLAEKTDDYTSTLVDNLTGDLTLLQKELHKNSKSIQTLRDSNNVLRRTIRELNRKDAFDEAVLNELKQQFNSLEDIPITINKVESSEDGTTILVLSDTHFGEVISPTVTNGYNVYNNQVCKDRILKVVRTLCTASWTTNKLKIYLLGDLVNGVIHQGDMKGEEPVMASLVDFARFLGTTISALAKAFNEVDIVMVNGNHSRLSDTQKTYQKAYDFEYIIYNMLTLQLPVQVTHRYSNTCYAVDVVEGHNIGLFHGDTVRGYQGDAGTAAYKVQNIIESLYDKKVTSLISGHTHKPKIIANQFGGLNIVNGTTSGIGEYGLALGFDSIYPSQTIARIDTAGQWKEAVQVRVD